MCTSAVYTNMSQHSDPKRRVSCLMCSAYASILSAEADSSKRRVVLTQRKIWNQDSKSGGPGTSFLCHSPWEFREMEEKVSLRSNRRPFGPKMAKSMYGLALDWIRWCTAEISRELRLRARHVAKLCLV